MIEGLPYLVCTPSDQPTSEHQVHPKTITILDPACGSGHFLLYALDLLLAIYEEYYERLEPRQDVSRADILGDILMYNLFGIDIDTRACQIAEFALYLKAKRIAPEAQITKMNIVCAQPMPGEPILFEELLSELGSPTLERMVREIWQTMELAGEAGSLLRIEQRIREVVSQEREREVEQRLHSRLLCR